MGQKSQAPITFTAVVYKVQTLVDGGLRFTLDAGEDAVMQAAQLIECKRFGALVEVAMTPVEKAEHERNADKHGKIHI